MPSSVIATDARHQVRDAIAAAVQVDVVSPAPEVPIPPMVAVTHGTPWQEPTTGGRGMDVHLRCLVAVRGSQDNTDQLEELVEQVTVAIPAGWMVDSITAPALLDTGGQGSVLVSEVLIHASFAPPVALTPPPVNPDLAVDNYADGFVRIQYLPLLDDQAQHDGLTLGLAVVPGANGVLLPDLDALEALRGDVWYDHNGTLGHVLTASGTNLGPTMLARYIREHRTIDARLDLTVTPPVFHIVFAHLPPAQ